MRYMMSIRDLFVDFVHLVVHSSVEFLTMEHTEGAARSLNR